MFNTNNRSLFYAGGWLLANPDTGKFWADEAQALAWLAARTAADNPPAPADAELPVYDVTNIQAAATTLRTVGPAKFWLEVGNSVQIGADVALPNGEIMVMVERMVRGSTAVSDIRRPVVINNGRLTLTFTPRETGLFVLDAARLNAGLIADGHDFQVAFPTHEFDVYDPV